MPTTLEITGPGYRTPGDHSWRDGFVVHAAACPTPKSGNTTVAARSSRQEVVELVYGDETWEDYLGEFTFAPCCAELPLRTPPPPVTETDPNPLPADLSVHELALVNRIRHALHTEAARLNHFPPAGQIDTAGLRTAAALLGRWAAERLAAAGQ